MEAFVLFVDRNALTSTVAQDNVALVMLVDDFSVGKRLQILSCWIRTHHGGAWLCECMLRYYIIWILMDHAHMCHAMLRRPLI